MNITYEIAQAAGTDKANHRMRKAGRKAWNRADYNAAVREMNRLLPITARRNAAQEGK